MGYYLETPGRFKKAEQLLKMYAAQEISPAEAAALVEDATKAIVCVVQNPGLFDAAAFCYSPEEFRRFNHISDDRPRRWLLFSDRSEVEDLTGYRQDAEAIARGEIR